MFRKFLLGTTILFLLSWSADAHSQERKSSRAKKILRCTPQIEAILSDTIFRHSFVGIKVVSLKSGKTIFDRNADKLFRPASNAKLFVTAAVLALLGENFPLRTELYADSSFWDGVLRGPLYIKGFGDPLLSIGDIDSLARLVLQAGIHSIRGGITGDVSYFDTLFWGRGWMWDDDPESHAPYLSALSVNANMVTLSFIAGSGENDPVRIVMEPATKYCEVINRTFTSSDTVYPSLHVTRVGKERGNLFLAEGRVRPYDSVSVDLSVWRPELYLLTLLKERLLASGVAVDGPLRFDTVRNAQRIAFITHKLDSAAALVNKESYNLGAENLLKILAAETRGTPGSADTGLGIMRNYLYIVGVDTSELVLVDGSGKSRYNLASPNAIVQLLVHQYKNTNGFEQFLETLPVAGVDGTLKSRMTRGLVEGRVRAKTGSHSDASTLSGYVTNTRGELLAFSILMNHFTNDAAPYRKAQDRIVEILVNCR